MKRKLRIGVIDLVAKGPTRALYARLMHANLASIMPQAVAAWCEEEGHEVEYVCYTGFEDLRTILPKETDLVFVSAFTEAAQLSYALAGYFRSLGIASVLGGPHARCYPEDARKYFDYVLGLTDRNVIRDVLADCSAHRPMGVWLKAAQQPRSLPGVRERWKFIRATLSKAPWIQVVPMIASFGCPYTCSFCIDAVMPYQPLDLEGIRDDLRFLRGRFERPLIAWHDPNFGVRFDETLDAIEEAIPPDSADFIAESSLSILSEERVKRLRRSGFKAVLPGVESWFDLGGKSRTGKREGAEKVKQVGEHVRMILRYIPYVQTNFVLGLDADEGPEPFELTKRFVREVPAAFPGFSLLTAFGRAAPINLEYQREGRVVPFPFHFLNNNEAMNVRPRHYAWPEFYDRVVDLVGYAFSCRAILNRFASSRTVIPMLMNLVRAVSSEGWGRLKYYRRVHGRLARDPEFRPYFEGETRKLPRFYREAVRRDLGPMWDWLPEGAIDHDPDAYLKSVQRRQEPFPVPGRKLAAPVA